jgi:hypothetical protein
VSPVKGINTVSDLINLLSLGIGKLLKKCSNKLNLHPKDLSSKEFIFLSGEGKLPI